MRRDALDWGALLVHRADSALGSRGSVTTELTIFGPISMDLYLPVLPALTTELRAATSVAQLTVTACLLGLAASQLVAGPLSDRFGRRRPLLVGVVAYVATSPLCALSPTIETWRIQGVGRRHPCPRDAALRL